MGEAPYRTKSFPPFRHIPRNAAEVIVPLVLGLIPAGSVCDVGCGRGTWLNVFREHGVAEVFGIDGDYIPREELEISPDEFMAADLERGIELDRTFDLAVSLEVAEHLSESSAGAFIDALARLAPVVLFSAAIPGQGGMHHVNEQWPEYWADHFHRHDFQPLDCIRPAVWDNRRVQSWYAQNTILFVESSLLETRADLQRVAASASGRPLAVVHPKIFEIANKRPWLDLQRLRKSRDSGEISQEEFDTRVAKILARAEEHARDKSPAPPRPPNDPAVST